MHTDLLVYVYLNAVTDRRLVGSQIGYYRAFYEWLSGPDCPEKGDLWIAPYFCEYEIHVWVCYNVCVYLMFMHMSVHTM